MITVNNRKLCENCFSKIKELQRKATFQRMLTVLLGILIFFFINPFKITMFYSCLNTIDNNQSSLVILKLPNTDKNPVSY